MMQTIELQTLHSKYLKIKTAAIAVKMITTLRKTTKLYVLLNR